MPRPFETSRTRWSAQPVPRLPHPSWSRAGQPAARAASLSAADFWHRLGL